MHISKCVCVCQCMQVRVCVCGGAQCMGENKFPWVVATPNSLAAKSQQQRMRIAAAATQSTSLLTHKFNVCVFATPFSFALSFLLIHTHTRRHD